MKTKEKLVCVDQRRLKALAICLLLQSQQLAFISRSSGLHGELPILSVGVALETLKTLGLWLKGRSEILMKNK